jgi:multicomponent Na+:H+ antiporter subunit D
VGALLQVVFHSFAKNVVFLVAGVIILKTHKTLVADLRAIGKEMPVAIWCFALASLSLIGIPPLAGFIGKWFLASGSLDADIGFFTLFGPALLLFSALLAAGYLLPIVLNGFFPGAGYKPKREEAHGDHNAAHDEHGTAEHLTAEQSTTHDVHSATGDYAYVKREGEFSLTMPIFLLAAAALIFGIFSGGLISLFERIANVLL